MSGVKPTTARPVSDWMPKILDPVVRKRGLAQVDVLKWWAEIVGQEWAGQTVPERIQWPRDTGNAAATLIVGCDPSIALALSYERDRIRERLNAYLGFPAIGKIRFRERSVIPSQQKPERNDADSQPDPDAVARLNDRLQDVEPGLREAIVNLARGVLARS